MRLIRKDITFIFDENYKEIFKEFKAKLIFISILGYYDLERETILKLNILDGITVSIFSQFNPIDK